MAEANSSNGSHLATANLVGANIQLNWPCYNDGVLTDSLRINGYTTGPANYIRVYTPTSSNEVGVSQRHRGGFGTGFQLNGTANAVAIQIDDEYVRVEGLVVQHTVTNNSAVWAVFGSALTTSDVRISHNIVKGVITGGVTGGPSGIEVGTAGAGQVFRVWDNVVYNFNTTNGVGISLDNGIAYVFNNTVFNCFIGVWKSSGVTGQVRNNVSINDALNASFTDYVNLAGPPSGHAEQQRLLGRDRHGGRKTRRAGPPTPATSRTRPRVPRTSTCATTPSASGARAARTSPPMPTCR